MHCKYYYYYCCAVVLQLLSIDYYYCCNIPSVDVKHRDANLIPRLQPEVFFVVQECRRRGLEHKSRDRATHFASCSVFYAFASSTLSSRAQLATNRELGIIIGLAVSLGRPLG